MIGLSLNKRFHFDPTEDLTHPRPLSQTASVNAYAHHLYSLIMWVSFVSIFIDFPKILSLILIDSSLREKLPTDKPILENSFIATHECLNAQENIAAVTFMENESIRLAKERHFYANIATNSNPLTQQLDQSVFGYETLVDFQSNQFVVNGRRPFNMVPDSNHWMVQWKKH